MDVFSLISALRWLATPYWRLLRWLGRRPFMFSSKNWALMLFLLVATGFSAIVVAAPILVLIVLALIAFLTVSALAGWMYLRWPAEKPVVFVAKFAAKTLPARDAATDHLDAVNERLMAIPEIESNFELRILPEPLSLDNADLLLAETGAAAVLFGEVRASDGTARWKLQMLMQWPVGDGSVTNVRITGPKEVRMEQFSRSREAAPRHEQFVDASQPLRRLADESFESDHADRAAGTLLVFAADLARHVDKEEMKRCLEATHRYRSKLSPRTLAALELMRITSEIGDLATLVGELEVAGESGADHPDLWNALLGFAFLLKATGELESERFLRYAKRAVRADPDDAQSRYNLGEAFMANGEVDRGLAEFEALTLDEEYAKRPYLYMNIGIIHYNYTHEVEKARDAYKKAAELSPSPQAFLYLADSQRILGEESAARNSYRQALLLDPTLVDAHRGYTAVAGGDVAPPLFNRAVSAMAQANPNRFHLNRLLRPLLWQLLLWHYGRHPEDSRLHYMLGYCALLRGEFGFAIERLVYAYDLFEGADLEALAVAATAMGLNGDKNACETALITLRDSPMRPQMASVIGGEDSLGQRLAAALSPFIWEPRLAELPSSRGFQEALATVFPDLAKSGALPANRSS